MVENRLDLESSIQRLNNFPQLKKILGNNWLRTELRKPIEKWSLFAGWLCYPDDSFYVWLSDIENALILLQEKSSLETWIKICAKVKSHSDRANSKGTLSELAICVFLASMNLPFRLEVRLSNQSKKDVDIQFELGGEKNINIEVQWLSSSDVSDTGALIASQYQESYQYNYGYEKKRIKEKIFDKTSKFTYSDITFIAFDITTTPEWGGQGFCSLIYETMDDAINNRNINMDNTIASLVDGVLWFELSSGVNLLPHKRNLYLNPNLPFIENECIKKFASFWQCEI